MITGKWKKEREREREREYAYSYCTVRTVFRVLARVFSFAFLLEVNRFDLPERVSKSQEV